METTVNYDSEEDAIIPTMEGKSWDACVVHMLLRCFSSVSKGDKITQKQPWEDKNAWKLEKCVKLPIKVSWIIMQEKKIGLK